MGSMLKNETSFFPLKSWSTTALAAIIPVTVARMATQADSITLEKSTSAMPASENILFSALSENADGNSSGHCHLPKNIHTGSIRSGTVMQSAAK